MMKRFVLLPFCWLAMGLLAVLPESRAESPGDVAGVGAFAHPAPSVPWSVVGVWKGSHPDWTDTVNIAADGTFFRTQDHDSGRWTLTALQDRVILVLAWDHWPATTVTMMSPDEFTGKVRGGSGDGEMTLHRWPAPAPAAKPGLYETKVWRQGEPPVRLIRQEEGFCALTMVTGSFQGGGEWVKVYVADDGYWYLGGESQQEGVAAECIVVRFRHRR